jgi:tyrosyl-tRNA synthetase
MSADLFAGEGMGIVALMAEIKMVPSRSEGFRTIQQGGLTLNGEKVTDMNLSLKRDAIADGEVLLQTGKKNFKKVIFN